MYTPVASTTVFDLATQSIAETFPLLEAAQVAVTPDGSKLVALNHTTSSIAVTGAVPSTSISFSVPGGQYAQVSGYDAADNLILATDSGGHIEVFSSTLHLKGLISVGGLPDFAIFNRFGYTAFGLDQTPELVQFNPVSLRITGTLPLPGTSAPFENPAFSPDGNTLYLPFFKPQGRSEQSPGIAVIDTKTLTVSAIWPMSSTPYGITISPDGTTGYVEASGSTAAYLAKLDLTTGATTQTLQLASSSLNGLTNAVLSPEGATVYASANGTVFSIDAQTLNVKNSVPLATYFALLDITPDGNELYISGYYGEETILAALSLQTVGLIPAGPYANAIFVGN